MVIKCNSSMFEVGTEYECMRSKYRNKMNVEIRYVIKG